MKLTFLTALSIGQGGFISMLTNDPKPTIISGIIALLIEVFRFLNRRRKEKQNK